MQNTDLNIENEKMSEENKKSERTIICLQKEYNALKEEKIQRDKEN